MKEKKESCQKNLEDDEKSFIVTMSMGRFSIIS
jgi:hypothetical protein